MPENATPTPKRSRVLLFAVWLCLAAGVGLASYAGVRWYNRPVEWTDTYADAVKQAKAEHKKIFLYFTGSDWCVNCFRLDDEVYTKPAFIHYARKHYVLVELDFPLHKDLPDPIRRQNDILREKYQIGDYLPKSILLDSDEKKIGEVLGYDGSGVDGYLGRLDPDYPVHPVPAPAKNTPTAGKTN